MAAAARSLISPKPTFCAEVTKPGRRSEAWVLKVRPLNHDDVAISLRVCIERVAAVRP
jgi:hypothetical protein